jgi:hypothetical protein
LAQHGRVTLLVYRGHAGGAEEYAAVRTFLEQLPDNLWHLEELIGAADFPSAPRLFRIGRK